MDRAKHIAGDMLDAMADATPQGRLEFVKHMPDEFPDLKNELEDGRKAT